jgi:hypothetical protein
LLVADDLFINFDDRRAAAAFDILSDLATRTQVTRNWVKQAARDAGTGDEGLTSLERSTVATKARDRGSSAGIAKTTSVVPAGNSRIRSTSRASFRSF